MKAVSVDLLREGELLQFDFLIEIPGMKADFMEVDFDALYAEDEYVDLDLDSLRTTLEALPCCALGGDRKSPGDPLNFVIIGDGEQIVTALANRGWHVTQRVDASTVSAGKPPVSRSTPWHPVCCPCRPEVVDEHAAES